MRITGLSADPTLLLVSNGGLNFYASSTLPDLHMGDTWRISITGQQPFQPVTVAAYHDGNYSSAYLGVTDAQGNFDLHGTFDQGSMGHWQETYRVLGTPVGILLDFSVLPSRTTAPAAISAPPPVVTVAPAPSAINPEAMSPATYTTYEQALAATVGANLETRRPAPHFRLRRDGGTGASHRKYRGRYPNVAAGADHRKLRSHQCGDGGRYPKRELSGHLELYSARPCSDFSARRTRLYTNHGRRHGCPWLHSDRRVHLVREQKQMPADLGRGLPGNRSGIAGNGGDGRGAQPEWISGIPNYAVLAGAAVVLLLIARR